MIASQKFAQYAEYALQGMQLLFLKFSRDDERQADALGVEYSSKISYDAHKMADFFQVLNKMSMAENQGGVPTFLSTHPDPGDRYNSVNQSSTEWQSKLGYNDWKVNKDSYLQMVNGIIYGEDPRQGYVEGNTFYHPELKFRFTYPAGWKYENTPTQVNMGPEDGKALMVFTLSSQKTLQNAADTTLQQLGLTLLETKNTTVNGMQAKATVARQVNQDQSTGQQSSNLVLTYFIQYSPYIYVFHGVSTEADFNTYFKTMESAMMTFAKLTDPSKINVKPTKLLVTRVPRTTTLGNALTSYNVPQSKLQEVALLNNMELTSTIQAGQLIKVIGQ
jgi:predicted Zn-dependent protease